MVAKRQEVATTDTAAGEFDWHSVNYSEAFQRFPEVVSTAGLFGDGFTLLDDKMTAVGKEFLILDWKFIKTDSGDIKFVSMRVITPFNDYIRINDGGTGICAQLKDLDDKGIHGGIHCAKGLRVSDYDHPTFGPSKTFYLA